VKAVK